MNIEIHSYISEYLKRQQREYLTEEFGFSAWTAPNTMFNINNDLPSLMLKMTTPTLRVWLRCLNLMKRNHDPVYACNIYIDYKLFNDLVAKATYYRALKELRNMNMIRRTPIKNIYIIEIFIANKLYKPKIEL